MVRGLTVIARYHKTGLSRCIIAVRDRICEERPIIEFRGLPGK
jgi:hypothetical protein